VNKLNLLLLVAVLASGVVLVHSAYDARLLFTRIDDTNAETRRLEADYQRLQAERRAQATNLRVEGVARDRLQMRTITAAVTQPASDRVGAPAASGTSGAAAATGSRVGASGAAR